jgi:hypothetical protein
MEHLDERGVREGTGKYTFGCPQAAICIESKDLAYYCREDTPLCTPKFWWIKAHLLEPIRADFL